MDPRTGDFVKRGGASYRLEPLDADWVLERFPPARLARRRADRDVRRAAAATLDVDSPAIVESDAAGGQRLGARRRGLPGDGASSRCSADDGA